MVSPACERARAAKARAAPAVDAARPDHTITSGRLAPNASGGPFASSAQTMKRLSFSAAMSSST
jgi:hypothetical protein